MLLWTIVYRSSYAHQGLSGDNFVIAIAMGNKNVMDRRPVVLDTSRPHMTSAYGIRGKKIILLRD